MDEETLTEAEPRPAPAVGNTITPISVVLTFTTDRGDVRHALENAMFPSANRMAWLHQWLRDDKPRIEVWPALLTTTKTSGRVITVGPFGDTDMPLGHFLRTAQQLEVVNLYARYLHPPASDPATLGDGLVVQFLSGGVLHIWSGARPQEPQPDEAGTPSEGTSTASHPNREQQEVIDFIVAQLVADPGYRALTRKGERENYARTECGELEEAMRGEHPVLPPNFVYRVLMAAAGKVDQGARAAYAKVEDDLQDLLDELNADPQYLVIADKTARRYHLRTMLFERYGQFAPPSSLVARLLDATDDTRPIRRSR
ncbi:hypothetical protein [Amycolatopsis minnesotensis]|uniref:hypothetical protein n=1 Tax=Amycolatopsis minnesotensis TaxID=337894 RepID=UPI0031D3444A